MKKKLTGVSITLVIIVCLLIAVSCGSSEAETVSNYQQQDEIRYSDFGILVPTITVSSSPGSLGSSGDK